MIPEHDISNKQIIVPISVCNFIYLTISLFVFLFVITVLKKNDNIKITFLTYTMTSNILQKHILN